LRALVPLVPGGNVRGWDLRPSDELLKLSAARGVEYKGMRLWGYAAPKDVLAKYKEVKSKGKFSDGKRIFCVLQVAEGFTSDTVCSTWQTAVQKAGLILNCKEPIPEGVNVQVVSAFGELDALDFARVADFKWKMPSQPSPLIKEFISHMRALGKRAKKMEAAGELEVRHTMR
jgi:hypothetical protein